MLFGDAASVTSWKPFRRVITALAMSYFGNRYLVSKHKKWLDMVKRSDRPDSNSVFAQADR